MIKNFTALVKKMNGKEYTLILKDLKQQKEAEEVKVLGVFSKTTNMKINKYGDQFSYSGRFLSDVDFNIDTTSQTLVDGEYKYAMELEYDFNENGNNKQLQAFRHRCFLLKKI